MSPQIGITCSTLSLDDLRGVPRYALAHHYVDCVVRAGGLPVMLPNLAPETASLYVERFRGLLLTGGLDVDPFFYGEEPRPVMGKVDPRRDRFELELARQAHAAGMPIFAICRGVQLLNVAFGGTLIQHIPADVPNAIRHEQEAVHWDTLSHGVSIVPATRLHAIAGADEVRVNSFHHQAVDRLAEGFVVSATAPDGVIEGIEDPAHSYCVGVQWHPERRSHDELTQALFRSFVEAAARVPV